MTLGDRESTGITQISKNQLLQAKPVLNLCFRLLSGDSGGRAVLQREQEPQAKMALPSEFPFWMPSRQDGSGHGWIHHSNSSEFLQQKSLLSEIQTELTSAIACAVIQREASANKSLVWHSVQRGSGEHPENGFNSSRTGYRSFQRGSITCFKPSLNALKDNFHNPALVILKKKSCIRIKTAIPTWVQIPTESPVTPEFPNPYLMHTTRSYAVFPFSVISREHWFIFWTTFSIKAAKTKSTKESVERNRSN